MLMDHEERRIEARREVVALESFNPINLFQRIDRAQCGYLSHQSLFDFI